MAGAAIADSFTNLGTIKLEMPALRAYASPNESCLYPCFIRVSSVARSTSNSFSATDETRMKTQSESTSVA